MRATFDWRGRIRAVMEPGLSTCIARGHLTLDGVRVAATWIDVFAMRLAERAVVSRQSLVLCPPEAFDALPALTAAAVHIWRMTDLRRRTGQFQRSDYKVAVVTSQFRVRGIYRR